MLIVTMEFQQKTRNNSEVKMCGSFIAEKHVLNSVSKLGTTVE